MPSFFVEAYFGKDWNRPILAFKQAIACSANNNNKCQVSLRSLKMCPFPERIKIAAAIYCLVFLWSQKCQVSLRSLELCPYTDIKKIAAAK